MGWEMECHAPRQEAQRRVTERQKRHAYALQLRAEGLPNDVISERSGVPKSTLHNLFRGLGRRS